MKRYNLVLAAVAALLGPALAGSALAEEMRFFPTAQSPVYQTQQYRGGWGDRFRHRTLEGRWVLEDRYADANRGNGFGGRGLQRFQLPNVINIDQEPSRVRIADRRNRPVELIMLSERFNRWNGGDNPDYLVGHFHGTTLMARHVSGRGATITQTFELQNRGRILVVTTKREGRGGRTVEITSTYHRA